MKQLFTFIALFAMAIPTMAQTTAVNWTATDCNNVSHTLYNELDNGKVIVFAWVMPCGTCVAPTTTAYNVVQSFATSHPGKVAFYMADDLGNASCLNLTNWVTSNNIGSISNMTIFNNSNEVIDEDDFGGSGMPHIVVMGGPEHKIYFNKFNNQADSATVIEAAINEALIATAINDVNNTFSFSVSPNPIRDYMAISYTKPVLKMKVMSMSGQIVIEEVFSNGKMNPAVDFSKLASGMYTVMITDADNKNGIRKIVKQ